MSNSKSSSDKTKSSSDKTKSSGYYYQISKGTKPINKPK